jgi:hypothetical protein
MKSEENSEHHFRKEKHTNLRRKDEKKRKKFSYSLSEKYIFFRLYFNFFLSSRFSYVSLLCSKGFASLNLQRTYY